MVFRYRPNEYDYKITIPETDIQETIAYLSELWGEPNWQDNEFVGNDVWCVSTIHQVDVDLYTVCSLGFNSGPALAWALLKWETYQ
jgi:hypothetical protein